MQEWEVTKKGLEGALCKNCYSYVCRHLKYTLKSQSDSDNSELCQRSHAYLSKLLASSPQYYLDNQSVCSERLNLRASCGITGHKHHSCSNLNIRHYTTCVCSMNQSVWNHTGRKGLKTGRDKAGQIQDEIFNPLDRLQQFVAAPLLSEKEHIFRPSVKEITRAQRLFVPGPNHKIEFLKSALFEEHLPDYELPEVAFIGRSNVGKSSLIQMLLSKTDVSVRVSKNPGHTKLLNFFRLGEKLTLVDMPGYGYNMPEHYAASVETFLSSRKKLTRTFILVDSTVGITENDIIGLNMLEEFHISYVIVMTKIDKRRPAQLLKSFMQVKQFRDKTQHCFQQPFLVSSVNGDGIPFLQTFIAYVTGCLAIQGL